MKPKNQIKLECVVSKRVFKSVFAVASLASNRASLIRIIMPNKVIKIKKLRKCFCKLLLTAMYASQTQHAPTANTVAIAKLMA
jgi:hypothetical protein